METKQGGKEGESRESIGKDCGRGGDKKRKKGRKGEGGEERENERGNLHITTTLAIIQHRTISNPQR